jgi:protein-tyrosine phosphatase
MSNLHFNPKLEMNLKDVSEILPNLYLGNKKIIENHSNYFELLVNCTPDIKIPIENIKKTIIQLPIKDDPFESTKLYKLLLDTQVLYEIKKYVNEGKKVLVFCSMGMQRSAAVVACYLIKFHKYEIENAITFIKSRRPIAFLGDVNFLQTIYMIANDVKLQNCVL